MAFVFIILFVNTCCQAWRERERERERDSMDSVHATYFMGGKSIEGPSLILVEREQIQWI